MKLYLETKFNEVTTFQHVAVKEVSVKKRGLSSKLSFLTSVMFILCVANKVCLVRFAASKWYTTFLYFNYLKLITIITFLFYKLNDGQIGRGYNFVL